MNDIDITIKYQNGTEFNITKDLEDKYKTDKLSLTADQLRFLIDLKNTLIERFISENKELKEKNRQAKMRIVQLENEISARIEDVNTYYIPKSKVEELIEKLSEELEIMKVDNMYGRYKEYGGKKKWEEMFQYKYGKHDILQSLLGKE